MSERNTWARFERAALDTCDGWRVWLVWPQFLLEISFMFSAPIHDAIVRLRSEPAGKETK